MWRLEDLCVDHAARHLSQPGVYSRLHALSLRALSAVIHSTLLLGIANSYTNHIFSLLKGRFQHRFVFF